jgi:hypothetical protein
MGDRERFVKLNENEIETLRIRWRNLFNLGEKCYDFEEEGLL